MSAGRKTVTYAALACVLAAIIIVGTMFYIAGPSSTSSTSSISQIAGQSVLAIQLTDPPQTPQGTLSLNLTYSAVNLLVGEPGSSGQVKTSSITLSPSGGSATLDLLKLQNVSQTLASTSLPTGSIIYSIGFTVKSISIDINGTIYPVALATGGTTLGITLAHPAPLSGDSAVLLELNPVVADTPTGYQMIPSMVGIMRPPSEYHQGDENVGSENQVSQGDNQELDKASGQISARLVSLAVSGNTTTFTILVNNTGGVPVTLVAIGIHGNFTSQGGCPGNSGQHGNGNQGNGNGNGNSGSAHGCGGHNEVVFSPLEPISTSSTTSTTTTSTSSTTSNSCSSGELTLASGGSSGEGDQGGLVLGQGQCIALVFSGTITFGNSAPIIPSTLGGQRFIVHVVASNNGQMMLACTLPLTPTSCTVDSGEGHSD